MRKLRGTAACLLLCVGVIAGCAGEDNTSSTARCAMSGFEDMNANDPDCGKLLPKAKKDDLSVREERLLNHTIRYFIYNEPVSENWMLHGQHGPKIQRYKYLHVTVVRLTDRDIVGIEVSDVCPVDLWDESTSHNLGCSKRGLQDFDEITPDDASVVFAPEAVAVLTRNAHDAERKITFALSCLTRDEIQPDGSVYDGPPGCPAP